MVNNDLFEYELSAGPCLDCTCWYNVILRQVDPRIRPNVTLRQFMQHVVYDERDGEWGEVKIHYFDPKLDVEYASLDEKYRVAKLDFRDRKVTWIEEPKVDKEKLWNACLDEYRQNKVNSGYSYNNYDIWLRKE